MTIATLAKVPSGIRSELRGSSASFMSYIEGSSRFRRWGQELASTTKIDQWFEAKTRGLNDWQKAALPPGIKKDKGAVAETIANNVRSTIIKEKLNDPAFYDSMSALLNDVLADLRANRISYEEFLQKIADLATQVQSGKADSTPKALDTPGKRALFNNLGQDEALALRIHAEVKRVRPDGFRGNQAKENIIKRALLPLLGGDAAEVERIFSIIKAQPEY
jgi:type I restriction enzyme R subunit